ncbi:hypothetical protein JTB14_024579 [Gonioctena quinquepunctata]|nr:hypothetical protein JTB14_024579 [Gonioctena quinquepunctata]
MKLHQKYRRRPHSEEEPFHQDYVQLLTTYLSLRLALDPNVKDFNISMDDKRWHTFGDIVIDVKYKNRSTVYAIKCKRVYEFPKTIDSFDQSRIRMEKEYESLTVLRNLQEFSNARFLIFSTCNTSPKFSETDTTVGVSRQVLNLWRTEQGILPDTDYLIVKPSKRNDLVNVTSDSENIFSIYPETENESFKLPPVFFYTSQIVFPWMIDDLLKKKFEISIKKKYSKYIEEWAEGNLGGNYYLNKRDVIIKVGEILLFPYMMLPKKIITADEKNFEIWNKVMNRVDLIVVERKNHVNGRMCEPLNQMIEEKFGKIDEVSKTITISDEIVKGIEDSRIKAYLFEEYDSTSLKYKISLSKFYKIFWKSGKTPIPLSSEKDPEQDELIVKVISFMKQYGVNLKFLLKTSRPTLSEKTLNIFGCLDDVKELVDLKKVGFTIPGGFVSLDEIRFTDPTILKMITPNQFFDMALGKYSIQKDTLKKGERLNGAMIILDKKTKDLIQESLGLEVKNTGRLEGINPLWF